MVKMIFAYWFISKNLFLSVFIGVLYFVSMLNIFQNTLSKSGKFLPFLKPSAYEIKFSFPYSNNAADFLRAE
jgi:hypothetical protein